MPHTTLRNIRKFYLLTMERSESNLREERTKAKIKLDNLPAWVSKKVLAKGLANLVVVK